MTAENSEDSNAQQSETDTKMDVKDNEFKFTINNVTSSAIEEMAGKNVEVCLIYLLYIYMEDAGDTYWHNTV